MDDRRRPMVTPSFGIAMRSKALLTDCRLGSVEIDIGRVFYLHGYVNLPSPPIEQINEEGCAYTGNKDTGRQILGQEGDPADQIGHEHDQGPGHA